MADERDEIRARIDIVTLVGQRVSLVRRGKTWKGLCPFHEDRNPSFDVNSELGRYRCWSCGESGDIFNWVMKTQNVEFHEALTILADMAGVTLKQANPQAKTERQQQKAIMDDALAFFREQLFRTPPAQEYCAARGIDAEMISTWELGYAPDLGEALAIQLQKRGHGLQEARSLFLVDQDTRGGYFDKFRGRLIFPIRDERGELVAFGGRILGQGIPKYINSSDTPLYRKGRVLYGMNVARDTMSKVRQAVLTEGYLDTIACHRAGVKTAIASLGTALSEDHAKLLKRWVDEVVVLYDADAAGEKAAERAIEVLKAEGIRTRVALMPPGEDPDTLLKTQGPDAVRRAVEEALPPLDYQIRSLRKRRQPTDPDFWPEVVGLLATAPSPMELERHLMPLASEYPDMQDPIQAQRALRKWVATVQREVRRTGQAPRKAAAEYVAANAGLAPAEIVLFRGFLADHYRASVWRLLSRPDLLVTGLGASLATAILQAFPESVPHGPASAWLHEIQPESLRNTLGDLVYDIRAERQLARKEDAAQTPEELQEAYVTEVVTSLIKQREEREVAKIVRSPERADPNQLIIRLRKLKGVEEDVVGDGFDPFA